MAANKSSLISGLMTWQTKGKNGDFSSSSDGLSFFSDEVVKYWKEGADSFGNKLTGASASILNGILSALFAPTEVTSVAAQTIASALSMGLTSIPLETTNTPPGGLSVISNIVAIPVQTSSIQPDIKNILDKDRSGIPDQALMTQVANEWADVADKCLQQSTTLITYIQNAPPIFPTVTASSGIS